MSRGRAVRQLVGLITGWSGVQVPEGPLLWPGSSVGSSASLSRWRSRVRAPSGSHFFRLVPIAPLMKAYAGVAQLAEQLICNQQVAGSSPIASSILFYKRKHIFHGWVPEWPKGADCKSAVTDFGGSNPPPSTACGNGGIGRRARFRF